MKKFLTILVTFFFAFSAQAAEKSWKINPAESKLEFKATQDKTIITGSFKKFDGKIIFDKNQLFKSSLNIEIDTSSIAISLSDAAGVIQSPEWLSTKAFPKATFISNKISLLIGKNIYRADGTLTIKGRPMPVSLEFYFNDYSENKAQASGKTKIKRSAFAIGDSDIKKANGVKEDVEITFLINAEK
jgi:polyisoprenoid-binding protein YceI